MEKFNAKAFKLGNSTAVYIPKGLVEAGKTYSFLIEKNEEQKRWWCHPHKKWNTECGCGGGEEHGDI